MILFKQALMWFETLLELTLLEMVKFYHNCLKIIISLEPTTKNPTQWH